MPISITAIYSALLLANRALNIVAVLAHYMSITFNRPFTTLHRCVWYMRTKILDIMYGLAPRSRRYSMALLVRQNDPRYERCIKLLLADHADLGMEINQYDYMHVPFEEIYDNLTMNGFIQKLYERIVLATNAVVNSLTKMMRVTTSSILTVAAYTLTYIYNNGGLIDYEKQKRQR